MKKRILTIIMVGAMILGLVGCSTETIEREGESNKTSSSMFVEIEKISHWKVVYHRKTKVMYAVSNSSYNCGTFTLLVDSDGNPMLYEK